MAEQFEDMEAFLRVAKYTLVRYTDMNSEMKEEAMDLAITAVEKYPNDMEKCTQVGEETHTQVAPQALLPARRPSMPYHSLQLRSSACACLCHAQTGS